MRAIILVLVTACSYSPTPNVAADDTPPIDTAPPVDEIDSPPAIDACVAVAEVCNGALDEDCNGAMDCADPACTATPYCCTGSGRIHTASNGCTDDFGMSGSSDELEVYCCDGQTRFCLSKEACPWRNGCVTSDKTCVHTGLSGDIMAMLTCERFQNQTTYACGPDEQIVLTP